MAKLAVSQFGTFDGVAGDPGRPEGYVPPSARRAGTLDEMRIHLVPLEQATQPASSTGLGPEPIEVERIGVIDSPAVTHLRFAVIR
jgi:hypothetical protein